MTLLPEEPSDWIGAQEPRVSSWPPYTSTTGDEAVALCELAGLFLDPWQQYVLRHSLGERSDGNWAAFEVGVCVPRQNGKGSLLVARELVGLFLLGEQLIIHSAHQQDTSLEGLRRLESYIKQTPELHELVKAYRHANGTEGIELHDGRRVSFRTRTGGGGRGWSCNCLILDEAMIIPDETMGALLYTLSAMPNPQVWYTGSAVDKENPSHRNGVVFAKVRERGLTGTDPSLAYFEWSADLDIENTTRDDTQNSVHWRTANPGGGYRITADYIEKEERASPSVRGFAVERLGVGDWPSTDPEADRVINMGLWQDLTDPESEPVGTVTFAFDITPDHSTSIITAAGRRSDGLWHIEVAKRGRGTDWLPDELARMVKEHNPSGVYYDGRSSAEAVLPALKQLDVATEPISTSELAQACGIFYDAAVQNRLRHRGQSEITAALDGAKKRTLGDKAWLWNRKTSLVDISPLVCVTIALWGAHMAPAPVRVYDLNEVVDRMRREGRLPEGL